MSYVFISHASNDKTDRVRPIVEALVFLGLEVWVDTPHASNSPKGLGLKNEFIREHGIKGLANRTAYDDQIRQAIRSSGAVLACLSAAWTLERTILNDEVKLGEYDEKLRVVLIDGSDRDTLPRDSGLISFHRAQIPKIDGKSVGAAMDILWPGRGATRHDASALPAPLLTVWEDFVHLADEIRQVVRGSRLRRENDNENRLRRLDGNTPEVTWHLDAIDRGDQTLDFEGPFERILESAGVGALFLCGPIDEEVAKCVDRLKAHVGDKFPRQIPHRISFDWPRDVGVAKFRERYLRMLSNALRTEGPRGETIQVKAEPDHIARELQNRKSVFLVENAIPRAYWDKKLRDHLRSCLETWQEIAESAKPRVIVLIHTSFERHEGTRDWWMTDNKLFDRFPCPNDIPQQGRLRNREIIEVMHRIADGTTEGLLSRLIGRLLPEEKKPMVAAELMTVLTPVQSAHLRTWLDHHGHKTNSTPSFDEIFKIGDREKFGVPMGEWLAEATRLVIPPRGDPKEVRG